jgi:hypothetical protein
MSAFAALLAGCAGGSQLAPAGSQDNGATQSVVRLGNRIPHVSEKLFAGSVAPAPPYLYASDFATGDLDVSIEDNPVVFSVCAGCAGWGLAVRPGPHPLLAAGTLHGTVNILTPTATPTILETLKLSAGGAPLGLCFDFTGGLWATNATGTKLDYFNAALVNGTLGGTPTRTITAQRDITYLFYIACDADSSTENTLYAYGITRNNVDVVVDQVNTTTGNEVREVFVGTTATHFPAGLAISVTDDLVVNDQNQTLWDMGRVEPWHGTVANGCTWGPTPSTIWSIAWDNLDAEVWGGDDYAGPPAGEIEESFAAPIPHRGPCRVGESGGPSGSVGSSMLFGTAVYPNRGN